uniref:cellulase n=1 Tax=Trichogramma kaykai TaxID=54128 RepID=A0ABD2WH72_9HYME
MRPWRGFLRESHSHRSVCSLVLPYSSGLLWHIAKERSRRVGRRYTKSTEKPVVERDERKKISRGNESPTTSRDVSTLPSEKMKINRGYGGVFVTCVAFFVLSLRAKFIQGNGSNVADIIGSSANRARNIFAELDNNDGHEAGQEKRDDYDDESDYAKVLELSPLFYEAQRSGKLAPGNRIARRDDSALDDHGNDGEDLTGGYYDAATRIAMSFTVERTFLKAQGIDCINGMHFIWAGGKKKENKREKSDNLSAQPGNYVKFGFTIASATTLLAWGIISLQARRSTGHRSRDNQTRDQLLYPPLQLYRAASTSPDRSSRARLAESAGTVRRPAVRTQSDQFRDHLEDFVYSEAMLNYNAGFTSALTGLLQLRIAAK